MFAYIQYYTYICNAIQNTSQPLPRRIRRLDRLSSSPGSAQAVRYFRLHPHHPLHKCLFNPRKAPPTP